MTEPALEGVWSVLLNNEWCQLPCELNKRLSTSFRANPRVPVPGTDLFGQLGTYTFDFTKMKASDVSRNTILDLQFAEPRVEGAWSVFWNQRWCSLPSDINSCLSATYHHNPAAVVEVADLFHQPGKYSFDLINMVVTDVSRNGAVRQADDAWQVSYNGTNWYELPKDLSERLSASFYANPAASIQTTELFGQPGRYSIDFINMTLTDDNNPAFLLMFTKPRVEGWWCAFWEREWRQLPPDLNNRLSTAYHNNPAIPIHVKGVFCQPWEVQLRPRQHGSVPTLVGVGPFGEWTMSGKYPTTTRTGVISQ